MDKGFSSRASVVCFGELLWDMLPSGARPGGAPMNVAYHLRQLGLNPALISRVGRDRQGTDLLKVLEASGIQAAFVQQDEHVPTGIVHAQASQQGEMSYEIVAPAAWDHIKVDIPTMELVQRAGYFVFGSLAARDAHSRESLFRLLEAAQRKVLDINLRPPFFSRPLVESLLEKADILKMNEAELGLVSGWLRPGRDITEQAELICNRFGIPVMIVTLGAAGAMLYYHGKFFRHGGYRVEVADTIGSGDSFLAAFLSGIINNTPPAEALAFAAALGALVASRTGGCPAYTIEEVRDLQDGI